MQTAVGRMSDAQKTAHIQQVIREDSDRWRARYPILARQNLIGGSVMAISVLGIGLTAWAYAAGFVAWWLVIPLVALLQSLIHELEHDLIHLMYFKDKPWAYHLMLLLCWLTRPSTVSPWLRRELHLHHHKVSGSEADIEERGITNGEQWGLRRLLMTGDNILSIYLRPLTTRQMVKTYLKSKNLPNKASYRREAVRQLLAYFPLGILHYALWHGWVVYHVAAAVAGGFGVMPQLPDLVQQGIQLLDFWAVAWMLPSHLRTFCLHFISSNMHYYGDIESRNVLQQCQVLNAPMFWPFQLFCFNFGSTHAIHHFVVKDPFYIRQLTVRRAHQVMREMGVRFNDLGTFGRSNRFYRTA